MLGELSSAGMAWLAIDMAGPGGSGSLVLSPGDARVIDIADPDAVPAAVNPLEPAPGYPIQAHADWLAGLFEAAFGLEEPVATAIRAGLRRTYAACGWDTRTGTAAPGAVTAPVVPAFRQLRTGILAATGELGYSQSMQTGVRGFLSTRLDALWAGPRPFPRGRSPGRRSAPATRKRARHQQRCGRPRYRVVPGRRAPGQAGGATASARRRRPRPGQEFSGRPAAHRRHRLCGAPQRTPRRVVRTPPGGRMVRSVARGHRFLRRGRDRGSPGRDGRIHRAPAGGTRARRDRVAVRPPSRGSCGA